MGVCKSTTAIVTAGATLIAVALFACGAAAQEPDIQAKARASVSGKLFDPDSARFADVRVVTKGGSEIVCGRVNAKNRMGGYDGAKPFFFDPAVRSGAIIYGGASISDDLLSGMALMKGFEDVCG